MSDWAFHQEAQRKARLLHRQSLVNEVCKDLPVADGTKTALL